MAYLALIWKSAFRNRTRTVLTALGVAVAIVAFLFLRTFIAAWYAGVDASANDRMIARNKTALIFPLPLSYVQKAKNIPGVADVSWANWCGMYYKDPHQFFANFAADADSYLRLYPEFILPPEQLKAFQEDRRGAVVGTLLAERFGWKLGDTVTLSGTIYPGDWTFTIRGIYTGREKVTDTQQFIFQWKYLNETVEERRKDKVGWLVLKVNGGGADVARNVDTTFANSTEETRTESEKQFQLSFISMVSTLIKAIQVVSFVVLIILMLILANTLAMATRERTTEYAVMRAIGFKPGQIVGMVLMEGLIVAAFSAALGLSLAPPILAFFADIFQKRLGQFLGTFDLSGTNVGIAVGAALAGGMLASAIPAWRAGKLKIVDALRRVE
jgi:putative ABC transport system permease protein